MVLESRERGRRSGCSSKQAMCVVVEKKTKIPRVVVVRGPKGWTSAYARPSVLLMTLRWGKLGGGGIKFHLPGPQSESSHPVVGQV